MTISLKHSKTSTVPDSGDTSLVQPSDWNSEHTLSCATGKIIGRSTSGVGNAEEISIGAGLLLSGGTLSSTDAGGTVTTVSVVSANGLTGTVANASTTPAITLSTSVTGLLKGNGTAISAASSGTDYAPATSGTDILKGNGAGGFANASAGTDYVSPSVLGAANGVATLGSDSKLTSSQIPDISVVTYLGVVASQSAMLGLTGQQGDWCTRSDLGTNWIITGSNPALLASWTQLSYPTAPVTSVNTQTGAVVLSAANVGAQPAITVNGIIKGNGSGTLSAATSGTDYAPATSGSAILKGNGSGGFSSATAGTDYSAGTSSLATGLLKSTTSTGALSIAVGGTDYQTAQSVTGIVKSSGTTRSAAVSGTDYSAGTSSLATGIIKSTTSTGALSIAVSGTDYAPATSGTSILYGNGSGGFSNVTVGSGLSFSAGTLNVTTASVNISNDTTTATNLYPAFLNATTGTTATLYTGNANLLYKPSTGELQAQELIAANGLIVSSATISASYSIPSGSNAMSPGPVAIASGQTVTVPSGSVWVVV